MVSVYNAAFFSTFILSWAIYSKLQQQRPTNLTVLWYNIIIMMSVLKVPPPLLFQNTSFSVDLGVFYPTKTLPPNLFLQNRIWSRESQQTKKERLEPK